MIEAKTVTARIGEFDMSLETGKYAKQAHGAVFARYGNTAVLATVVRADARPDISFFPLTVEYRESKCAAGKIPGGFFKREGKSRRKETLTCRLIDRPIRPLFPEGFKDEIQVSVFVYSADPEHDPDVVGMNAASAALCVSNIPFAGPVGACRVGRVDGKLILNPDEPTRAKSDLDLVVAGTEDSIVMVESNADEVPEAIMIEALQFAHDAIKELVKLQLELVSAAGKEKFVFEAPDNSEAVAEVEKNYAGAIEDALKITEKLERYAAIDKLKDDMVAKAEEAEYEDEEAQKTKIKALKNAFNDVKANVMRRIILSGTRIDGRSTTDVRPIWGEVGFLPGTHGSAVFTRGETQAFVIVTLGSMDAQLPIKGLHEEREENFYLHYDFHPFSVGEVGWYRGPGRREIGHGMLAQKALEPVVPDGDTFPYVMRINSHITESNGSSSMASVCGGTLAMMDAGVKIKNPVAGIAMGLVMQDGKHAILSDILGDEDHYGDMDFKVTGTENGVTALQMDIKIKGLSQELLADALNQAKEGRMHILGEMMKVIDTPSDGFRDHVPQIIQVKIDPSRIGAIIGPGGKNIKKLEADYAVDVNISDDGMVQIMGQGEGLDSARKQVDIIANGPGMGKVYKGLVKTVKEFGAFVEIVPGVEGLVHISDLDTGYVKNVDDFVKVGDVFDVKVINIDDSGKIKLSRKALLSDKDKSKDGDEKK